MTPVGYHHYAHRCQASNKHRVHQNPNTSAAACW